jgi:hypothetical protein
VESGAPFERKVLGWHTLKNAGYQWSLRVDAYCRKQIRHWSFILIFVDGTKTSFNKLPPFDENGLVNVIIDTPRGSLVRRSESAQTVSVSISKIA